MSSPQLENGYIRIANELYEAILRFPFTKRELLIVLAILRKTYGYRKKTDRISLSQIANLTSVDRAHISRTLRDLVAKRVLLKEQQGAYQHIGIAKNYKNWKKPVKGLPKQQPLPKEQQGIAKRATKPLPNEQLQKTVFKDILKDSMSEASSSPPAQVISIPLKDGSEYPVTQSQIQDWVQAYPGVDVMQALKEIRQWNISNPKNRKTKAGILRHITGWLKKDQDSSAARIDTQDIMAGTI